MAAAILITGANRGLAFELLVFLCGGHLDWGREAIRQLAWDKAAAASEGDPELFEGLKATYTMAPKDLEELFNLAYEAACHEPNWPANWPKGRKQRREALRDTLRNTLSEFGFQCSTPADGVMHWPEKRVGCNNS